MRVQRITQSNIAATPRSLRESEAGAAIQLSAPGNREDGLLRAARNADSRFHISKPNPSITIQYTIIL